MGSLSNDNSDGNENSINAIGLDLKKTTLHMHRAFLYISLPSLNDCNTKLPIFTHPLYGVGDHNRKVSFSFSKLRCAVRLDSIP